MKTRFVVGVLGACLLASCEMSDSGDAPSVGGRDESRNPTVYSDASRVTATSKTDFEMRPRPSDEKDFPDYIQYLVDVVWDIFICAAVMLLGIVLWFYV